MISMIFLNNKHFSLIMETTYHSLPYNRQFQNWHKILALLLASMCSSNCCNIYYIYYNQSTEMLRLLSCHPAKIGIFHLGNATISLGKWLPVLYCLINYICLYYNSCDCECGYYKFVQQGIPYHWARGVIITL